MDHIDQDSIQSLSIQSHHGLDYNDFILMNTTEKCNSDSNCMKESDGDGSGIEVKMDFPDDLLHMVCSREKYS